MAKPIEPTPILTGDDAERLQRGVEGREFNQEKQEFLERCEQTFEALSSD